MHPKALLDACAELVRLTLTLEHPADAVVSRFFRDNRNLGPRERATLAETVYTVLRKKLLFDHLADRVIFHRAKLPGINLTAGKLLASQFDGIRA